MKHNQAINSSYRCQRVNNNGRMQILNENSYVIAEYNEHTGAVSWLRVVLAAQKLSIERWLAEQHPVIAVSAGKKSNKAA
jgi:hypothetical protein